MKTARAVSVAALVAAVALAGCALCRLVAPGIHLPLPACSVALALAVLCLCLRCLVECSLAGRRRIAYFGEATRDFPDAISWLDPSGRILTWNRGAQEMYGYSPEEVLGKHFSLLIPRDLLGAGELEWMDRQLEEKGLLRAYRTRRVAKGGRELIVEVTRTVIRDARGRIIGSSAIARDVTRRREMEESLARAERLAAVGGLAGRLAHEVRNPLTSLILNAEMLSQEIEALPPERAAEARELLSSILDELRRISRLLQDYLGLARQGTLQRRPCDLVGEIKELLLFLEGELMGGRIEVVARLPEGLPPIPADERQLRQIFMNLFRNAMEAMPSGGTLTVEAAPSGGGVLVSVTDTGPGVAPGEEERIWEPFYSTKKHGTGLGLSIVKEVVEDHGGWVSYARAPEGGAVFTVWLPAERSDA